VIFRLNGQISRSSTNEEAAGHRESGLDTETELRTLLQDGASTGAILSAPIDKAQQISGEEAREIAR
jgi:hypothetical protein